MRPIIAPDSLDSAIFPSLSLHRQLIFVFSIFLTYLSAFTSLHARTFTFCRRVLYARVDSLSVVIPFHFDRVHFYRRATVVFRLLQRKEASLREDPYFANLYELYTGKRTKKNKIKSYKQGNVEKVIHLGPFFWSATVKSDLYRLR